MSTQLSMAEPTKMHDYCQHYGGSSTPGPPGLRFPAPTRVHPQHGYNFVANRRQWNFKRAYYRDSIALFPLLIAIKRSRSEPKHLSPFDECVGVATQLALQGHLRIAANVEMRVGGERSDTARHPG